MTVRTHCRNGHAYTRENTIYAKDGSRRCRTCHREYERKSAHKNREQRAKRRKELRAMTRDMRIQQRKQLHKRQDEATARIIDELCAATASNEDFLFADVRVRMISQPRQVAFLALRNIGLSLPHIGRIFGRDHSTVSHGVDRARVLVANDQRMAKLLQRFEQVAA